MSKTYLAIPEFDVSRLGSILSRAEQLGYVSVRIGLRHVSVAKAQTARHRYERHVLETHKHRSNYDALTKAGKFTVGAELSMQKSMKRAGTHFCLYLRELGLLRSLSALECPYFPNSLKEDIAALKEYWDSGYRQMREQLYNE